mgnify:CR=1 FL=1
MKEPAEKDIEALESIEDAKEAFDKKLNESCSVTSTSWEIINVYLD